MQKNYILMVTVHVSTISVERNHGFQAAWQFRYQLIECKPNVSSDSSTGFCIKNGFSINFSVTLIHHPLNWYSLASC